MKHTLAALVLASGLFAAPAFAKAPAAGKAESFTCTEIIGVSVTGDWYNAGFEKLVDDGRFQSRWRTKAFIELWGDPKNEVWSVPITSPCKSGSASPDRVVFTGVNWQYTKLEEWTAAFTKVVETLTARYSGVKRIELLTMLRAPGNKTCGNAKTVVAPEIDEAIKKVAAAFPKVAVVGPKVEAPSCAVFTKGGPHFTPEGMSTIAHTYAAAYGGKS